MLSRVGIVGAGRLGSCLGRALAAAFSGAGSIVVASEHLGSAQRLAAELGGRGRALPAQEVPEQAELVFLTVPDGRIAELAGGLAFDVRHAVVHASGALGLDALAAARARGARSGVFHPLQAFPLGAPASRFAGVHIGIEADAPLDAELSALAGQLGASAFSLRGVDRAAYHAAAVFASNYLVALQAAAAAAWQRAGLPAEAARAALLPLARGALDAIAEHPLHAALTGPLQRGDVATLERHLAALEADPARADLYRALARELLRLPLPLDPARRAELERLLERHG